MQYLPFILSPFASHTLRRLRGLFGELVLHQPGPGLRNPVCYRSGEFVPGADDVYVGDLEGTPCYVHRQLLIDFFDCQLVIGVTSDGGGQRSLETQLGLRFLTHAHLNDDCRPWLRNPHGMAMVAH